MPRVCVVILNYKVPELAIDCLRSLEPEVRSGDFAVLLADSPSGDDSPQRLREAIASNGWEQWVGFTQLPRNGGYAYGNNALLRQGLAQDPKPDYFHLLNPDTVLRPGSIDSLVEFMERHPDVGITGSRLEDPDATPQRSSFRFPTVWSEIEGGLRLGIISRMLSNWVVAPPVVDEPERTGWVAGASMMVRREVFEQIGLFDEEFFLYYEEVDFCLRAQRAGWSCWYVPHSHVVHLVGQSTGVTDTRRVPDRRPSYWFESRRRYFLKNFGSAYTALADICGACCFALWRLRRVIQRKPDIDPPQYLNDFLRNSVFVKGFQL